MADKVTNTRFNEAPRFFGKGRTKFDLSHSILTTGNTGDLIPILCEPVVPGSTFSLKTASLTRLETSLHQTMDCAYVEFAYFFVPSRILWTDFDKYQGFNRDAWAQTQTFQKPQLYLSHPVFNTGTNAGQVLPGSLLNHLCLPAMSSPTFTSARGDGGEISIDQLPVRAVFKAWNDWFREPNYDSEIYYADDNTQMDLDSYVLLNSSNFYPARHCLKVNRFKDVFSTALPQPQKGDPIEIKIGDSAPVGTYASAAQNLGSGNDIDTIAGNYAAGDWIGTLASSVTGTPTVIADLSDNGFTVNDLRIAIAMQAMRERDARSGNRLNEKLYGTWHIEANSLDLDRSEFLGGKRIPVNMMEVLQTSETGTTVLGSDAGHSKTFDADDSFVRTFTQWGYVLGFVFVRTARSYSQGVDRRFIAKDILDEYDPMLDNIGEMPVYRYELNAVYDGGYNDMTEQKKAFGFQEAWYWYKERQNRFSGYFQNRITGTLSSWHYGDEYFLGVPGPSGSTIYHPHYPVLDSTWLKEGPENVDRTIAVQSEVSFQWMFNIHFEMSNTFEASKYSIPNTFGF